MSAAADAIEQAGIEMMGNIVSSWRYATITNVALYATYRIPLSMIFVRYLY